MTLQEIKRLDVGYWFSQDDGKTHPYRGQGVTLPTLEEVYEEFHAAPLNVEIKSNRSDIERTLLGVIERAGAEDRTLVVSKNAGTIRRFRKVSGGRVATGSSIVEMVVFDLLNRLHLSRLSKPSYQALQGPESYQVLGIVGLRIVTTAFAQAAHEQGTRVDVWTVNSELDMRRLLEIGVDGIITDRPDVLAQVLKGDG
jgi:glycerophosphoryl diester phosphodiesterase